MTFNLIDQNKLEIRLGCEELEDFNLTAEEMDYCRTETKRLLWDLLARAKHCTGFDTDGERMLVQVYPEKGGGCRITVTKLGGRSEGEVHEAHYGYDGDEDEENTESLLSRVSGDGVACAKRSDAAPVLYAFSTVGALLHACRRLLGVPYRGESRAYITDEGVCYLLLFGVPASRLLPVHQFSFLREYGQPETEPLPLITHLCEHAVCLCENDAVATLAALA